MQNKSFVVLLLVFVVVVLVADGGNVPKTAFLLC